MSAPHTTGPRASSREETSSEPAAQLRAALRSAGELLSTAELLQLIESSLSGAAERAARTDRRLAVLEERLGEVEADGQALGERLVAAEMQSARLMNLYVATYQLHATLDPQEVRTTIAEIALNLLGAERFVLLLRDEQREVYDVALAEGLADDVEGLYSELGYAGGDPVVDATLTDGALRVGPHEDSRALAVVPLVVQGATVGALVILKMLDHKPHLAPEDRDLLDLLAAHAASALVAAHAHAAADRKLRTLEGLVKLARRG